MSIKLTIELTILSQPLRITTRGFYMKKLLLIASIFTLLTACASPYPLGMSEEQWKSITPEERKALLLKQQQYNEEQRLERIKANAKQRELELKRDIAERKRLDRLYQNPVNGNVVMVNILGGSYKYGKRVKNVLEDTYQIARGETKKITLNLQEPKKHYHSTENVYLRYDQSGNGVYLYLDNPNYNSSKRIALLRDGNWACGTKYRKNLYTSYEQLTSMQLFVKEMGGQCGHHREKRRYY